jgi:hypothetical protein
LKKLTSWVSKPVPKLVFRSSFFIPRRTSETEATWKSGLNLASDERVSGVFNRATQIFKEVLRQMRKVFGEDQVSVEWARATTPVSYLVRRDLSIPWR